MLVQISVLQTPSCALPDKQCANKIQDINEQWNWLAKNSAR